MACGIGFLIGKEDGGREIFCEIYSFALAGKNLLMYNKNRKF